MRLSWLIAGVLTAAVCAAAPPDRWSLVCGPDGVWRTVRVPACAPAGPAPSYPAATSIDPASVPPRLPADPQALPPKPLVPLPPRPQPQASEPAKRPRPDPEIFRVETPSPLQVEPVGANAASIADSLRTLADVVKDLPPWPPTFPSTPAAAATASSSAVASAAPGPAVQTPPAAAPVPSFRQTTGRSEIVATWAQDLLYYALTGLAAAAGIALPGGAAGLAAWGAWYAIRAVFRRPQTPTASPMDALAATVRPTTAGSALPHLPIDYAKIWADHYEHDGGNARHEALKCDLYREAVALVRSGQLHVPGDSTRTADAIDNWVLREFSDRVSKAVPDENLYQKALLGFLYRSAVEAIRRGEIEVFGPSETADAIDNWVRREFAARLLHT